MIANHQFETAGLRSAAEHLEQWDLRTNTENGHAALGVVTLYKINELRRNYDGAKLGGSHVIDFNLPEPLVLEGFEAAVAHLNEHFGTYEVTWGEVNRLRRGDVDLPVGGGPDILTALYASFAEDGRLVGLNGDGHIMIVQWDAEGNVSSQSVHQFGSATLDETSPHYNDQSELFVKRQLKPMWLDEADIRANLTRAYRPNE